MAGWGVRDLGYFNYFYVLVLFALFIATISVTKSEQKKRRGSHRQGRRRPKVSALCPYRDQLSKSRGLRGDLDPGLAPGLRLFLRSCSPTPGPPKPARQDWSGLHTEPVAGAVVPGGWKRVAGRDPAASQKVLPAPGEGEGVQKTSTTTTASHCRTVSMLQSSRKCWFNPAHGDSAVPKGVASVVQKFIRRYLAEMSQTKNTLTPPRAPIKRNLPRHACFRRRCKKECRKGCQQESSQWKEEKKKI